MSSIKIKLYEQLIRLAKGIISAFEDYLQAEKDQLKN